MHGLEKHVFVVVLEVVGGIGYLPLKVKCIWYVQILIGYLVHIEFHDFSALFFYNINHFDWVFMNCLTMIYNTVVISLPCVINIMKLHVLPK